MNIGKMLRLAGPIAAAFAGGPVALAIPAGLQLAGELLGDDDGKDDLEKWERKKIRDWVDLYKRLMDVEMAPQVKRDTAHAVLRSDYAIRWARAPKERWVEQIHALMVMGAKGELIRGN